MVFRRSVVQTEGFISADKTDTSYIPLWKGLIGSGQGFNYLVPYAFMEIARDRRDF